MKGRHLSAIALYTTATLIVAGSNFLTTPLLLHLLGVDEFARWGLLEPLILTLVPLSGLGLNLGLLNVIAHDREAPSKLLPFHLGAVGLLAILTGLVCSIALGVEIGTLIATILIAEGGILFFIAVWRARGRPGLYAGIEGGRAGLLAFVLLVMTVLPLLSVNELRGYLGLRAGIGVGFFCFALMMTRSSWRPNLAVAKSALFYGFPIALGSVTVAVISNFDRFGVDMVAGTGDVARYVAHVKVTQILGSALAPFFTWFAPLAIRRLKGEDLQDGFLERSFLAFLGVDLALALGLWLIAPSFWPILFAKVPFDPALMGPLLAGMAIFSVGNPLSLGSLREGKTWTALAVTALAFGIGALAVGVLGPLFGATGVAWAKGLAMATYTVAFAVHTIRTLPLRYPWREGAVLVALALGLAFFCGPWIAGLSPLVAFVVASGIAATVLGATWALDRLRQARRHVAP